ncbi:hypothetical protein FE783_16375 [Paenibacillus mesophilus]|uniref:hypothetical protein n=1 Tax=Paenibacillus mesophilus TaxID=2582849 RepID=UPI00110F1D9B|nr:hypothetical protein [Paenibacillus mesophilus]TMV48630.1 hypothetical protein FE783_16375 [Paenibacillus mesophilus]
MSKYLNQEDLESIKRWVKELKNYKLLDRPSDDIVLGVLMLPYKYMGSGKHRIVFDLDNGYVLKVARMGKGIQCNRNEVKLYRSVPSELRKHLCKIADYGKGWVVMKKIDRGVPREETYYKKTKLVENKFRLYGVKLSDATSRDDRKPKRRNVRLSEDNEIVVIDYANVYDY